jgi:hypothetical protein
LVIVAATSAEIDKLTWSFDVQSSGYQLDRLSEDSGT